MATRDEVKAVIAYMRGAFPNYHPDLDGGVNAVDVMSDLLGDLPSDTLLVAVKSCCAQAGRQFAPSAGEIRGEAVRLHAKASGVPSASDAWGEVVAQMRLTGSYRRPTFTHPLVEKIVERFGWRTLCQSDNTIADRAHFLKLYESALHDAEADAAELPIVTTYIDQTRQIASGEICALAGRLTKRIPALRDDRAAAMDRGEGEY